MANRSVLRSTLILSRAHLLLRHKKPSLLSNPLFQDSSLQTLKPFSSSSFTITNHNHLFFSPSRYFCSFFEPDKHKDPMKFGKNVKLDSSSAITQGEIIVKRKPGRPRKIRPVVVVDETVSLTPPPPLSSLSQTQKRGRGRPLGSGKKKVVVELESSPVSSVPSLSLSQTPETQKRGRGRPPGSGKKKVVELESSPVSSVLSSSLSQSPETQKRGRGRPPGSGKKKGVELESSPVVTFRPSSSKEKEQWLKSRRERELMDQREEQKLKEQTKFVGQEQRGHEGLRQLFEGAILEARRNNIVHPFEVFLKVNNKRDLPDYDDSFW